MKWTIVGGGIHAITIALKLKSLGIDNKDLKIIDPHDVFCHQFDKRTNDISMPFLRSPIVHHVHPNPFHLKQYYKKHDYAGGVYGHYKRPQREMFMHHIYELIENYNLTECHIKDSAVDIKKTDETWLISLESGEEINSDVVVIASGCNHQLKIPNMYKGQEDIQHIFQETDIQYKSTSHVIGSGISAAHLTLKLIYNDEDKHVHLWTNKPLEVHDFDADPGWLGPKNMTEFSKVSCSNKKMDIILKERHKGSMPRELYLRLKRYIKMGRLTIHENEIEKIKNHHIQTKDGTEIYYDHILLATGFDNTLLTQPILNSLIHEYKAPLTECGYPEISKNLEWLPNLFVSGGLADLELGPFARNIMGGREAAKKIGEKYLEMKELVKN